MYGYRDSGQYLCICIYIFFIILKNKITNDRYYDSI